MEPNHPHRRNSLRASLLMLAVTVALAAASACGHKVGDSCGNGADCDPSGGSRTCDISQPGGYCIVEGCDARSCPSDSTCVRFFPRPPVIDLLTPTCDPVATTCFAGPSAGPFYTRCRIRFPAVARH